MTIQRTNWAGNVTFAAARFSEPSSVGELQRLVAAGRNIRVHGTGHSFNRMAETTGDLVSLARLPGLVAIDRDRSRVTVGAATRYGELGRHEQAAGFALHNTGSLPHIGIAGACATGTHGSGNGNGNLSTAVSAIQLVTADGDLVAFGREADGDEFNGMVLALGSLGVITGLTLDIVPTFDVRQDVYDDLPRAQFDTHFDDISTTSSAAAATASVHSVTSGRAASPRCGANAGPARRRAGRRRHLARIGPGRHASSPHPGNADHTRNGPARTGRAVEPTAAAFSARLHPERRCGDSIRIPVPPPACGCGAAGTGRHRRPHRGGAADCGVPHGRGRRPVDEPESPRRFGGPPFHLDPNA